MPDQREIDKLIDQLSPVDVKVLLNKLQRKSAKKPKTNPYIQFPSLTCRNGHMVQPCTNKGDVMKHLTQEIIQDCDKKSTPTIKAQLVESLATIAELLDDEEKKKKILNEAARLVIITSRDVLIYKLTTYAVQMH